MKAINKLKRNQDIGIKLADKGSKIVIMDKIQYRNHKKKQKPKPAANTPPKPAPLQTALRIPTERNKNYSNHQ